ncbi:Lonrf3 [Symbiodinium microadriaticum]|nr:Lonrf3 [Symbiodinium microadriaticum]
MAIDLQEGRSFRRPGGGRHEPPPRRRELEEDRYWQRSRPDRRASPSRRSRSRPRAASPPRRRREHEERGRERGAARRPSGRDDEPRDTSLGRRPSRSHASGSRRGSSRPKDKTEEASTAEAAEAPAPATSPTKEEAKKEPDVQKLDISRRGGFSVGQRVKARYLSGSFYTATIEGFLAEGKVLLQWADGDANDRKKSPEELVPCDASGHPLGSAAEAAARRDTKEAQTKVEAEAPAPAPPKAELTPAERAQAERIREFQRQRQGGEPKAPAEPAPAAAPAPMLQKEPSAGELPAAERQKLEERLQVLRVQYFRLHEQISADTASTEKEMQELVQSGAGEKELMNFRSERLSLQSGQRLAAVQISKQISEVEQKLNPDRGLRSEPETNGTKAKELPPGWKDACFDKWSCQPAK